jgi:hypothetical protein
MKSRQENCATLKLINIVVTSTGIVVWPKVAYLRVVGSFPNQWTGLSAEPVCVDSILQSLLSAQGLVDTVGRWKHSLMYPT